MKIVFMGTPDFAEKSLEAVYNAGHEILAVVTNPDKPKGRGMKMIASPVKQFAESKNLKIFQPTKVKNNDEFINEMKALEPDLFCVVAYGKILPQELLDIPRFGSINVHGSLLPKYRGAAPIQWAVLNGDKETGITTMFMDAGMDTGDMILKETVTIGDDETTGELWERLADIGAELLVKTISKIEEVSESEEMIGAHAIKFRTFPNNSYTKKDMLMSTLKKLVGAEKQGDDFSVAPMLSKEMAKIDWNKSSQEIHNLVRGLNPIMGAFTIYNGKKLKIWKTKQINDNREQYKNLSNGEVAESNKNGLLIKTGTGLLSILELQPENKKKMKIKDYLNGTQIKQGEKFE